MEQSNFFSKDKNNLTAFHLAARNGSFEVLSSMLSKCREYRLTPEDLLRSTSGDCRMPLNYAVERGHAECVGVLLEYGADPTVVSGHQPQPIHLACSHGKLDIVKLMVEKCGVGILQSHDREGGTTLHSSITSICSTNLIAYLVEKGVCINEGNTNGSTPLSSAIQHGNVHAVEELLKQKGDPLIKDKLGYTTLHRAVFSERIEVFKKIAGSDAVHVMAKTADGEGNYPIHHALKLSLHDMAVALLAITSEMFHDQHGNNYLHLAASSCEEKTLSHLLGFPFAQNMINEANSSGSTPLHCAAMGFNIEIVKKLLDYGAMIHKDDSGQTPFMCACLNGNLAAVELLYSGSQYQRDWVDHNGRTALHLAVDSKNPDAITFCLDIGMAIALNDERLSFFDKILRLNDQSLVEAVVGNKRWEECIETCSPSNPHPILRILDQMPDVYQNILNRCYTKCSLDPSHPDYWEEFNFKCLDITRNSHLMDRGAVMNPECTGIVVELPEQKPSAQNREAEFKQEQVNPFTVIHKLINRRLESYMRHPVVLEFIRLRWKTYGLQFRATVMLIPFLLALLFSILIVFLPTPRQMVPVSVPVSDNGTENTTTLISNPRSMSIELQVLFYITLALAILDLLLSFLGAYVNGLRLFLSFSLSINVWTNFIASVCIIIYIVSALILGVPLALWNAAAVGVLFAWFSAGFNLQYIKFLNIGVYIAMMVSTLKLAVIVASSLLLFLLGFVFSFHIVLGSVPGLQYDTIGRSMFSTLHSLIATTDFIGIVEVAQADELRFSPVVFFLLVVLIIMLPIVFINLLIGLAIGDITRIQREATFTRQIIEVHALSCVERKLIPRCWIKTYKKDHRHYLNKQGCMNWVSKVFHTTSDNISDSLKP